MVFRSFLFMALALAYVLPLIILLYVSIRARYSSAYAKKYGFNTKGDMRQFILLSLTPFLNVVVFVTLIIELNKKRLNDDTPLHAE